MYCTKTRLELAINVYGERNKELCSRETKRKLIINNSNIGSNISIVLLLIYIHIVRKLYLQHFFLYVHAYLLAKTFKLLGLIEKLHSI